VYALAIITAICLASVLVSYVAFRRGFTHSADDYFVAGSSLGYFVLISSLLASFVSAFAMFGMAGLGYRTGFGALFVLTVNLVPLGFLWYFIHRKTFLLGKARKWRSMGAPFGDRYGDGMRVMIPLVVLVASIPYLVAQIQGIGVMIEVMTENMVSYRAGLFFVPAFIALYLIMGGMKGVAWVNTAQGLFFTFMVFVLFYAVMSKNGGFVPTMDLVYQKHPELFQLGAGEGRVWTYPMLFGFASAMCLGAVCFPQPYMHAYSSRTVKGFKAMVVAFGAICVVVISMTTMIGIGARALALAQDPALSNVVSPIDADKVYGLAASETLPYWVAALAVAGGFTAAMTTVNGMVFGHATNIANDLYRLARPAASAKELVRFGQLCIAGILAVCVGIAWNPKTPVAELAVIAFGISAVTIFPLWGAYFWKRATRHGAIAATAVGVGMNILFLGLGGNAMVLFPQAFLFNLNGFLASFLVAGVVFFGVSLATRPGATEQRSLAFFFHPSLDPGPHGKPEQSR
jgi:solute:Na+ symporter, SSS family